VDASATFYCPWDRLNRTLVLVGACAVGLIILVTFYVSRRITRPLDRLTKASRAIGSGDFNSEIQVETADEIGLLANTLNEMRKSIQTRDRQLQMMLSGIAHEVRNPLGGMTLFMDLLRQEVMGQSTAEQHVDRITAELTYLDRVVNDFLDFARKRPILWDQVEPRLELEQIRTLCTSSLNERNVTLDITVADPIKKIHWDQERMRQALLNLVRNAIQASKPGDKIQIDLAPQQSGFLLSVSDSGCGIPKESVGRVFEAFFTTRQKGTGLGLALVRKIVESHSGRIWLEPREGTGSVFRIWLPAKENFPRKRTSI
jgi:signal transduction histidine kinase